jgi:hypothetical protein
MKRIITASIVLGFLALLALGVRSLKSFQMFGPHDYASGKNPTDLREIAESRLGCMLPVDVADLRMVHDQR